MDESKALQSHADIAIRQHASVVISLRRTTSPLLSQQSDTSIEYKTAPGPDGVQRAKFVTHLDPAREPAPRVYALDDVRNPQCPRRHPLLPGDARQRTRPPHAKEKHGAPRAGRQGRGRQTRQHRHPDPASIPPATHTATVTQIPATSLHKGESSEQAISSRV